MGRATIIYDGEDLASAPYGAELIASNVPGVPTPRLDVQDVPYGIGVSQGQYYSPLLLTATVQIEGRSTTDLQTKLDRIAGVMDVDSDRTLVFDQLGYSDRRWWARRSAPGTVQRLTATAARVSWKFTAADPVAESTTLTTENYNPLNNAWVFYIPDTAGTTVGGNSNAYPTYTLTSTGANGPPIKLGNSTRGETMWYIMDLPNTHLLKIDCGLWSVQKSTDAGVTWSNAIGSVLTSSRFPLLTPGVRNEMLLTNGDNTTLQVTYRTRHLGG